MCQLIVMLDEKGNAEVTGFQGPCAQAFEKLTPIKHEFWKKAHDRGRSRSN